MFHFHETYANGISSILRNEKDIKRANGNKYQYWPCFSSPEPKAHGAYSIPVEPVSVCLCVSLPTLLNINISESGRPIETKFYLKHQWGWGKAALGFEHDRIGTLVSMATDSSH